MFRLAVTSFFVLVAFSQSAAAEPSASVTAAAESSQPSSGAGSETVNSLYPLWEQTGFLHGRGSGEVGYQHLQIGLGSIQLGTHPYLDVYGTYNLEAKARVWATERLAVALVAGGYRIPTRAESRIIGNLHPTGWANPYAPVWIFPVSAAASVVLSPRFRLHATSTVLLTRASDDHKLGLSCGQSALLELVTGPHWRSRLHAGIEGIGVAGQGHFGLSFGYRSHYFEAGAGYARRMTFAGDAAHVFLFDGALLVP